MDIRCSQTVFGDRAHHYQCTKDAIVTRDGKAYCFQHDPLNVAERDKKRQEKWAAEAKLRDRHWARREAERKALPLLAEMLKNRCVPLRYIGKVKRLVKFL